MWKGGRQGQKHHGNATDPAALAASALRAYTTSSEGSHQTNYNPGYSHPSSSMVSTYQAHAMEALRRQEEIRHQAYIESIESHHDADSQDSYEDKGYNTENQRNQSYQNAARNESDVSDYETLQHQHEQVEAEDEYKDFNGRNDGILQASPEPYLDQNATEEISTEISEVAIPEIAIAEAIIDDTAETMEAIVVEESNPTPPPNPNQNSKRKRGPSRKKTPPAKKKGFSSLVPKGPTIDDSVPPITLEEYSNIEALMIQFCRVPLLAEFSRPVSLLHPELMAIYSKIVKHPMDLGTICRGIRRRSYTDTRAIRMDMWRIFTNCIKYHSHPSNRDNAVPAFISIALHLRDYFNALWQEYVMPSDSPTNQFSGKQPRGSPAAIHRAAHEKRDVDRLQRLASTSTTMLSTLCLEKIIKSITEFLNNDGRVDDLDKDELLRDDDDDVYGDMDVFVDNLKQFRQRIKGIVASSEQCEYSVGEMVRDLKRCYNLDIFENRSSIRVRIANRLDRLLGKILVPIYETSCRGVNQSSIWGCMAAAIWARESSKKPYWPALVLGILAPDCQREDWHLELTQRNEARLPEKLLNELQTGKRKAEQSIKRDTRLGPHQHSYFLVEFMGTHEFIWVKEGDIIETFDPDEDPNLANAAGNVTKKKRSSRNILDSKTFIAAIEEGRWALEEFELQLSDACGDQVEEESDDEQEMNYSYVVLAQSDDEVDEEDIDEDREMTASDIEEANELLANDGLIDYSAEGRKNARKRSLARKKEKANAEKAAARKEKSEQAKRSKDKKARARQESLMRKKAEKQRKEEKRELERKNKKRKDRAKKEAEATRKKRKITEDNIDSNMADKRSRATAIVNGYLTRLAKKEDMKNLCLSGVLTVPAAVVESSGLLGMALAFRAAAGEIPMPENCDGEEKFKPWENVDIDGPKTSAERIEKLQKQLDLLQKKLYNVTSATEKRNKMTDEAFKRKYERHKEIIEQEVAAKKIIMSRALKKKPVAKVERKEEVLEGTIVDADTNERHAIIEVVADNLEDTTDANAEDITDEVTEIENIQSVPVEAVIEPDT